MVFYNENKDEKTAIVECSCGTHGIKVMRVLGDNDIYISPYTDNFYSKQHSILGNLWFKIKRIGQIILGKEYRLEEIVLTNNDVDEFERALQEIRKVDRNESK